MKAFRIRSDEMAIYKNLFRSFNEVVLRSTFNTVVYNVRRISQNQTS